MAARCNVEESAAVAVDLATLLDAGEDALVTLEADETRLAAHKAVLAARSPVFAAMFRHELQEASSGLVVIADVEGPVLRQLLAYLYTLQAPQLPGMAPQLLAAADKYGLSTLKTHCEQQLVAELSVETAAAAAVLAVRHSCPSLREAAIAFTKANLVNVVGTQGWADAMLSQPKDLIEVSQLLAEPPAESSTAVAADRPPTAAGLQTQPHSSHHGQTAVANAPPSPRRHTPTHDGDAVTHMRSLSAEERGRRLIEAAKEGAVGDVEALLASGADVKARDGKMNTALHWAAYRGHVEVARCLLGAGAEVDARNSTQATPLYRAAQAGHEAVAQLLLAASADPNARQQERWTPLHEAAKYGHTAVVRLLIASWADIDAKKKDRWSPLHLAANNGHSEVAAALLEAGADNEARNNDGKTPLDVAREKNKQQLIDMLT